MTMPDLPERPGEQASDTRQMVERERHQTDTGAEVSGRTFFIALGVIVALIVVLVLLLR